MTSEIRVNKLTNRIGLSTVTFADSGIGVTVTGRIDPDTDSARDLGTTSVRWRNAYVDTYYGDGSNLTGITGTTINNNATTKFITGTNNANELDCEANLSYNNSLVTFASSSLMVSKGTSPTISVKETAGNKEGAFRANTDGVLLRTLGNYPLIFHTNQTERAQIDGSGRFLIGTNSVYNANSYSNNLIIYENGDAGASIIGNASNSNYASLYLTDTSTAIKGYLEAQLGANGNFTIGAVGTGPIRFTNNGAERLRIDSVGRVFFTNNTGNGTSRVGGRLELSQNNPETWITINESSDSGTGPAFYINRTRGSNVASPSPVENGNYIGSIHFGSYDTNSYEKGASIQVKADGQTWADGDCPARLAFYTTPDGETNPREWMRISNDGSISFARGGNNQDPSHSPTVLNGKHRYSFDYSTDDSSVPYRGMRVYGSYGLGGGSTDYSYAALFDGGKTHNNCHNQYITFNQITQQLTANTHGIYCQNSSSYATSYCYEGKMMKNLGAYTNSYTYHSNIVTSNSGGSAYHFRGADNDTTKVLILQNGDLDNANNSYSGLSDIKLKENIVDAGSQWDDIKNLKVRKFNFKAETGHETHTQIGLIAQETEPVSAGLVYEENDITVDESTGEGTVTGTTKHIKYSVLYMKAIKALQEAMTRIETLEQDNIALRARITNLEGN